METSKNQSFEVQRQCGFSLVELMIVVGVIGLLASVAMPKLQVFLVKARQAEGGANLRALVTLQETYRLENNAYYSLATPLVTNDYTSATSCHTNNGLGFQTGDCRNMRYSYATRGNVSGYSAWAVEIVSNGVRRVAPNCIIIPPEPGMNICPADPIMSPLCTAAGDAKSAIQSHGS